MTYIVALKKDDAELEVYPFSREEYIDFRDNNMGPICRGLRKDDNIRSTIENNLVGYIEVPILTIEFVDGEIYSIGNVWRI